MVREIQVITNQGGAYVRMIFEDNVGSFPCATRVVFDSHCHSFAGMDDGARRPYGALFWTENGLPVARGLPDSDDEKIEHLLDSDTDFRFPTIPNIDQPWEHITGGTIHSDQDGTESTVLLYNGSGFATSFNNTTAFNSIQFGVPQYPKRDTTTGNDDGYVSAQLFNCYTLQDAVVDEPINQDFYADVKGRLDEHNNIITSSQNIMEDILKDELNYNGSITLGGFSDWQHSFTLNEQKEAKGVFEGLFKSSLSIPSFDAQGQFKFLDLKQIIEDSNAQALVHNEDIIKYSFELSKIDDVKNQVNVKYKKNYASGDFDEQTGYSFANIATGEEYETYDTLTEGIYPDTPSKHYSIDYYGLTSDEAKLEVETEYIRDNVTARKLQKRLVSWYANQHLIAKIDLPVKYMDLEVGDYIKFDELLGGKLAFGQDYTTSTNKNGQLVYPVFFITKISKSLQKVSIEAIQVHRGEYGFPLDWEENLDDGTVEGDDWGWEYIFPDGEGIVTLARSAWVDEEFEENPYIKSFYIDDKDRFQNWIDSYSGEISINLVVSNTNDFFNGTYNNVTWDYEWGVLRSDFFGMMKMRIGLKSGKVQVILLQI